MKEHTLCSMIDHSIDTWSENRAVVHGNTVLTYRELGRNINSLARTLRNHGIKKGDSVALILPNIPEFVISYFAILKLGGVAVTLNTASTQYELKYLLGNSDSRAVIAAPDTAVKIREIRQELPLCRFIVVTEGANGDISWSEATAGDSSAVKTPPLAGDDPAVIVYTAGLTGKPLGAVLTHRNLYTQSCLLRDFCDGTERDRGLALIPLFHTFGATVNMLCALNMGGCLVMMDRFNLEAVFRTIEAEGVTYISAVPRVYLGMMLYEDAERFNVDSLRLCITGGSAMPVDYIPLFEKKFGVKLMEGYGLTEASPVCSFNLPRIQQKIGSIGVPVGDVETKIFDDEDHELPSGEKGELVIRGSNVMKGYYKEPQRTAEVLRNGWLHTGDLAWIDEEGYIFLTGRKKRMIITSGFNVYPKEVETVLRMHEAVRDVLVVGKEDLMRGEIIKAMVILQNGHIPDDKELMKHCRQYLSSYKVPREIEFVKTLQQTSN